MECKSGHNYAEALWAAGRFQECVHAARAAIAIAENIGQTYFAADALRVEALGHLGNNEIEDAIAALRKSLTLANRLGARYIAKRSEAVAFASGIGSRVKLSNFEFVAWAGEANSAGFGRAVLDFGRVALRLGKDAGLGAAAGVDSLNSQEALVILLASALRLNMNAFLMITQELVQHVCMTPGTLDVLNYTVLNEAAALGGHSENNRADIITRSEERGIKEPFNACNWDAAVKTLTIGA